MSRVVVTACTGRVGSKLCELLDRDQQPWLGLTRSPERAQQQAKHGGFVPRHGAWALADYGKPESLASAFADADRMFLATADNPAQDVLETALARAARRAGIGHIVKLSAQSAGLSPPESFGKQHARAEQALQSMDGTWTTLRPVFFAQSLLFFTGPIKKGVLPAATGAGRVAFVDAHDVANAACHVLRDPTLHRNKTYELTGSQSLSFADVATALGQRLGRKVRHVSPSPWIAKIALPLATGMPRWQALLVVELLQAISRNAQSQPTDTVLALTGNAPSTVGEFLDANLAAFR